MSQLSKKIHRMLLTAILVDYEETVEQALLSDHLRQRQAAERLIGTYGSELADSCLDFLNQRISRKEFIALLQKHPRFQDYSRTALKKGVWRGLRPHEVRTYMWLKERS